MENDFISEMFLSRDILNHLLFKPHPPSLSLQSYLDCCNSCEEVHKAYRRIVWALNPNKIDQVCLHESLPIQIYLESTNILY